MMTSILALLIPITAHGEACEAEAYAAEHRADLPPGLLLAIGRVESGRRGDDGRVVPWPWSVNAAGEGHYLASSSEAIQLVKSLQARGIRSIDVGCFQVNLLYHPEAFTDLADAFDPARNAQAAANFLHDLYDAYPSWDVAIARYHSADPSLGLPYMNQVIASWHGGALMKSPPVSQVAALVRVIVPQAFATTSSSAFPPKVTVRPSIQASGRQLPVVIVPSSPRL